jgi:hypothetical protein
MRYSFGDTVAQILEIQAKVGLYDNDFDWREKLQAVTKHWNFTRSLTFVAFGAFYGGVPGYAVYNVLYPRLLGIVFFVFKVAAPTLDYRSS